MNFVHLVLACIACSTLAWCGAPLPPPGTKLKVLCSRALSNAYVALCLGYKDEAKRSTGFNDLTVPELPGSSLLSWASSKYGSLLSFTRMRRTEGEGGIVDECCFKSCYIEEFLNYC